MPKSTAKPITPTPGRIVHYHPGLGEGLRQVTDQPLAAIVACVWEPDPEDPAGVKYWRVNLSVIDVHGNTHSRQSVRLFQPGEDRPAGGGFCEWMPYQVKKPHGSESGEPAAGQQQI